MSNFPPTPEQQVAIDLFKTGESLAIEAGAGTGKTATLIMLADSTDRRGQYVAFNKAIVVEASAKMPSNVNASTAHSLAFKAVGRDYADRLRSSQRIKSWELAQRLGLDPISVPIFDDTTKTLGPAFLAGLTMRALTRFSQTADAEPTWKHVPWVDGLDSPKEEGRGKITASNVEVAKWIEPALKKAWADAQNVHGSLPYKHDYYLKQYQLSEPKIAADFILFDEAQDANPVMVAVVAAQDHAQLVWVGDSQQEIYAFTGAVNALASVPADRRAFLTKSFRFGPPIADKANEMLAMIADAELRLTGLETIPSSVGPLENPHTILSRTNATAVRAVLDALSAGRSVHLVGGGREIISFARAAERLMNGQRVEHPELAPFESWSEVQDYVELDEQGGDLRMMVNLIDEFGVDPIIEALDGVTPEGRADLIVSTAHKAKGREWDTVQLAGDFLVGGKNGEPKRMPSDDAEKRLLYVAVTRARLRLDVEAIEIHERVDGTLGPVPVAQASTDAAIAKHFEEDARQPLTEAEARAAILHGRSPILGEGPPFDVVEGEAREDERALPDPDMNASDMPIPIPRELVVTSSETKRKPYKRASYREGVQWIAENDEPTLLDVGEVAGQISTLLLADLFHKDPNEVARAIVRVRDRQEDH